ncbi:AAA+-type ATPase [Savitreella phatthalungensis]
MKARKGSMFKKAPPLGIIEQDDLPTNFVVKAAPITSSAKQMRHLRRVYMHQSVMKAMNFLISDIVVVRLDSADEDEELAAFGVVFPSTTIESNVVQMHEMLRQSHLINIGDRVRVSKYEGEVRGMTGLSVCCIDEHKPSKVQDAEWREAITCTLADVKYVSEGMEFTCFSNGKFKTYTVLNIQGDLARNDFGGGFDNLVRGMNGMGFQRTGLGSEADMMQGSPGDLPELYIFDEESVIEIDHKAEGRPPTATSNYASPRLSQGGSTPMRSPAQHFSPANHTGQFAQAPPMPQSIPAHYTAQPRASVQREPATQPVPSTPRSQQSPSRRQSGKRASLASDRRRASGAATAPKFEEIDSDEEERIVEEQSLPKVRYEDIGGLTAQIKSLREVVELPLVRPHLFKRFNMSPPRGVLLYGPPGTGKTMLLRAIATESSARIFTVSGPSVVSKYMGEAEEKLRAIWTAAQKAGPSIIFLDEVDAIAPKRDGDSSNGEAESRIVASLLTLMDGMDSSARIVVIAATNRPNVIDPALRRPGRFDREIEIGIPDAIARQEILSIQLEDIPHSFGNAFVADLAARTHGFVGADLAAVCREAVLVSIQRCLRDSIAEEDMHVTEADVMDALPLVRPSAMREIFLETTKTRWSDVGGQEHVKQRLREAVEWPLVHPEAFKRLGVRPAKGVLLYGPPGCSKTLVAKALATESGLNFIAVKGPELFNKYVGEAERSLREVFKKARAASPSVVFFDELDAISSARGGGGLLDAGGPSEGSSDRLLTTLLNEMDGIEDLQNVTILAATNRPDVIDPALMRPGRLDRLIYVAPPNLEARIAILTTQLGNMAIDSDLDRLRLADETEGCSGAEIVAMCRDAGLAAMREDIHLPAVAQRHFDLVLASLKRGITQEVLLFFEDFAARMGDVV